LKVGVCEEDLGGMDIMESDLHNLYTWIDDIPLSRPKRNFTRDFSDGVLMAEVIHFYFPKLVQLHNYSSANSLRQKKYNWSTLNRKVFSRLGVEVSQEHLDDIANCKPRAIERLLKITRVKILQEMAMNPVQDEERMKTPDCSEQWEEANNGNEIVNSFGQMRLSPSSSLRSKRLSQIPRAPSQLSMTPPPTIQATRRPKSSFEVCSSVEKDIMIKEMQETNELLLAKISKLEQLIRLKDKKIDSLAAKLQLPNNYSGSLTP
jgi:hypothetical protein